MRTISVRLHPPPTLLCFRLTFHLIFHQIITTQISYLLIDQTLQLHLHCINLPSISVSFILIQCYLRLIIWSKVKSRTALKSGDPGDYLKAVKQLDAISKHKDKTTNHKFKTWLFSEYSFSLDSRISFHYTKAIITSTQVLFCITINE